MSGESSTGVTGILEVGFTEGGGRASKKTGVNRYISMTRQRLKLDYSGLHINLLYGLQGLQPQEDPYTLDKLLDFTDEEQRKIVKGLALMGINAQSPKAAFSAFRQDQQTGSVEKSMTDKQLHLLLDGFKEKHPAIADSICTDKGVELMK